MPEKGYNGWSNYETWVTKLWMDNEEDSYRYWQERSQEIYNEAEPDEFTKLERARLTLADVLKEKHEEAAERTGVPTTGVFSDLLSAAMSEIDWREIAESLLNDVEQEAETK